MKSPKIIQGGMGVAVSAWPLARAVSEAGELGVVSGTGLDTVLARKLQLGDVGGHIRRALHHFPVRSIADNILKRYFVPDGKPENIPFKSKPLPNINPSRALLELTVAANFVEVFLAKDGHDGVVGLNLLEKIQLQTVPSLFGAMLAGVDYVLMGAGIPRAIPAILDQLALLQTTAIDIDVLGALSDEKYEMQFEPKDFCAPEIKSLKRPRFLAIISSSTLALSLARRSSGKVDGFIVECRTAGGHNAPPRGEMQLSDQGEPIYGPRDTPDLQKIQELGLPFWLAGSYGHPEKMHEALTLGANGVQVGTAFAFCDESGIEPSLKAQVIQQCLKNEIEVFTDPHASPAKFPFKVAQVKGTLSEQSVYEERKRICDVGYLRQAYRLSDGTVGYRCPAEPIDEFVRKGGSSEETTGRKCVCNGLLATVGLGQIRKDGSIEPALITAGDDVVGLSKLIGQNRTSYSAQDVIDYILQS